MSFGGLPTVLGSGLPIASGGTALVAGPASSTDNAIVRWDGTGGNLVQNSVATIADTSGNLTIATATATITLGAATETLTTAVTAAGAGTITTKAGQNLTIANGASGGVLATGTGSHVFGTTNTVTMAAGVLTTTDKITVGAAAITSGSGTGLTVNETAYSGRVVHKVTTTFAAFSAAALTADKTIATLPAKTKLVSVYADCTATFTGGGVTDADFTLGTSAGGADILATFDVFTATSQRGLADADLGTGMTRAAAIQGGLFPSWTATTIVSARLTTVTANTDQLTTGSITWFLVTEKLP